VKFSGAVSSAQVRPVTARLFSWYRLQWTEGFLLQGGCPAEEFPEMLGSADSQLTAGWAEGRFSSPWLKPAKKCCCNVLFYF